MKYPSFEDVVTLIRESARLKKDDRIDPDTQLCNDLGISGKTGTNVLKVIEDHYQISLNPELLDRIENGRRTHPDRDEPAVIQSLLGSQMAEVPPITVGQLYKTVLQQLHAISKSPEADSRAF